jgi:hypothetical protein
MSKFKVGDLVKAVVGPHKNKIGIVIERYSPLGGKRIERKWTLVDIFGERCYIKNVILRKATEETP